MTAKISNTEYQPNLLRLAVYDAISEQLVGGFVMNGIFLSVFDHKGDRVGNIYFRMDAEIIELTIAKSRNCPNKVYSLHTDFLPKLIKDVQAAI